NGVVTSGYLPATSDTSSDWVVLFRQIHDKYIASLPFDGNVEYGMAVAYSFAQLMKKAGRNPSRQDVVNALEKGQPDQGPGQVPRWPTRSGVPTRQPAPPARAPRPARWEQGEHEGPARTRPTEPAHQPNEVGASRSRPSSRAVSRGGPRRPKEGRGRAGAGP